MALIMTMTVVLFFLFVSPYYIREVKYQTNSIIDSAVLGEVTKLIQNEHDDINLNDWCKKLMIQFPHYSWIGLKKRGSIIYLNIELNDLLLNNNEIKNRYGDLISGYDAYIKSINIISGKSLVELNQVVKKGTTLISGDVNQTKISPRGEIIGEVVYFKDILIQKTKKISSYNGNMTAYKKFEFGKFSFRKNKNQFSNFKYKSILLFSIGNFIKYTNNYYFEISDYTINYSKEDAISYAKSMVYYELEKLRTSKYECITNVDLINVTETDNEYIVKLLVRANKNIVVLKEK